MPVMLRTDEDYYVLIEKIDGSRFWLRDLTDDEYDELMELEARAREEQGLAGDRLREALSDPQALISLQLEVVADAGRLKSLRAHQRRVLEHVLSCGLVKWDLPTGEDKPDGTLLPAPVQVALARRIIEISDLRTDEATFPGAVGDGPPERE